MVALMKSLCLTFMKMNGTDFLTEPSEQKQMATTTGPVGLEKTAEHTQI